MLELRGRDLVKVFPNGVRALDGVSIEARPARVVRRARCYLLDEPFFGLRPGCRAIVTEDLARALHRVAAPVIVVTRDPADARRIADDIVLLDAGRMVWPAHIPAAEAA